MEFRPNHMRLVGAFVTLLVAAACSDINHAPTAPRVAPPDQSPSFSKSPDGMEVLRGAVIHPTVGAVQRATHAARPTRSSNLYYYGGIGGVGVETAPQVYVVYFG